MALLAAVIIIHNSNNSRIITGMSFGILKPCVNIWSVTLRTSLNLPTSQFLICRMGILDSSS